MVEAKIPSRRLDGRLVALWVVLLAFHGGRMQPHESIGAGYARALGYADETDEVKAMHARDPDADDRYNAAVQTLYASRGFDADAADAAAFTTFLDELLAEVPPAVLVKFYLEPGLRFADFAV
jgi:hypothetical protein